MSSTTDPDTSSTGAGQSALKTLEDPPPMPSRPTLQSVIRAMSLLHAYRTPDPAELCPGTNIHKAISNPSPTSPYTQVTFPLITSNWTVLPKQEEPIVLSPKDFRYFFLKQRTQVDVRWWWCEVSDAILKDACKICLRNGKWLVMHSDIEAAGGKIRDLIY